MSTLFIDDDGNIRIDEDCIRDDSTECDCVHCTSAEDSFWADQKVEPGQHSGTYGMSEWDFDEDVDDSDPVVA